MQVNSIQFLRAAAALLVVYEHSMDIQMRFGTSWQQNLYHLDNFGCIGVDLFFVISGFIITYVANKYTGLDAGMHFLEKRFYRINPVYYMATALFLGVFVVQLYINHVPFNKFFEILISPLIDSIIVIPTSTDILSFSPLLIVGWTLSFEWLFYFLFFILILFKVKQKTLPLSCLILLFIGIGQLIQPHDLRLQFITNPIMLEFVLGVIICQVYLHSKKTSVLLGSVLLSIGLVSYLLLIRFGYGGLWHYLGTISGKSSLSKFLLWGIPSSCIVAGCVFLEKNAKLTKLWNNKWILIASDASYSIYLIHYTVLWLLAILYKKTGFFLHADVMIWLQLVVAVSISIAFYKYAEKPILKYLQTKSVWFTAASSKHKIISDKTIPNEKVAPIPN